MAAVGIAAVAVTTAVLELFANLFSCIHGAQDLRGKQGMASAPSSLVPTLESSSPTSTLKPQSAPPVLVSTTAIAFDVGIRNLAYCKLYVEIDTANSIPTKWYVLSWNNLDVLSESPDINANTSPTSEIVTKFHHVMGPRMPALLETNPGKVEVAFIEAQPLARLDKPYNVKTKILSHVLQALVEQHGVPVEFVSPSLRPRDERVSTARPPEHTDDSGIFRPTKRARYVEKKRDAVERAEHALESAHWGENAAWLTWFRAQPKRDDLADSLLECLAAAERRLDASVLSYPRRLPAAASRAPAT
jgi:hypothetical protein